jgi:hypothetical protein
MSALPVAYDGIDNLPPLPIPRQEQCCSFYGRNGSGKTVLLRELLRAKKNVHLLDTKISPNYKNGGGLGEEVRGEAIYRKMGPGRYVWHTPPDFNIEYGPEKVERYFAEVFKTGNRIIGVDELFDVATTHDTPFSVNRIYTRGREKSISIWAGMQRPIGCPLVSRSEAKHKYLFFLDEEDDRDRMEKNFNYDIPWAYLEKNEFSFFYRDPHGDVYGPYRLASRLV